MRQCVAGPEEGRGVRLMKFEVVEVLEVQVKTRNVSRYHALNWCVKREVYEGH